MINTKKEDNKENNLDKKIQNNSKINEKEKLNSKLFVWSNISKIENLIPLPVIPAHKLKNNEKKCENPFPKPKSRCNKKDKITKNNISYCKQRKCIAKAYRKLALNTKKWNKRF